MTTTYLWRTVMITVRHVWFWQLSYKTIYDYCKIWLVMMTNGDQVMTIKLWRPHTYDNYSWQLLDTTGHDDQVTTTTHLLRLMAAYNNCRVWLQLCYNNHQIMTTTDLLWTQLHKNMELTVLIVLAADYSNVCEEHRVSLVLTNLMATTYLRRPHSNIKACSAIKTNNVFMTTKWTTYDDFKILLVMTTQLRPVLMTTDGCLKRR